MEKKIIRAVAMTTLLLGLAVAINGQSKSTNDRNPAVIVVGSAAKVVWVTTKFVVKDVAAPVGKKIFLQAAPRITVYALKKSPKIAAKILPKALKLALL